MFLQTSNGIKDKQEFERRYSSTIEDIGICQWWCGCMPLRPCAQCAWAAVSWRTVRQHVIAKLFTFESGLTSPCIPLLQIRSSSVANRCHGQKTFVGSLDALEDRLYISVYVLTSCSFIRCRSILTSSKSSSFATQVLHIAWRDQRIATFRRMKRKNSSHLTPSYCWLFSRETEQEQPKWMSCFI